jgi:hypothetical protein
MTKKRKAIKKDLANLAKCAEIVERYDVYDKAVNDYCDRFGTEWIADIIIEINREELELQKV